MCRGSPSSRATRSNSRSRSPVPPPRFEPSRLARSSGRSERGVHLVGPDVREGLGDGVDLGRRQAERGADVADGVPHPVGVHHRDAADPVGAEAVDDRVVDLHPPGGLHVDVDVGQLVAQRGEEALHQQPVAERVDVGDAQQVGDQAAGARAPRRRPNPQALDEVDHVGDGEEVGRVAELVDHRQLLVQPLPHPLRRRHAAPAHPGLAAGPQHLRGAHPPLGRRGDDVELGIADAADAEVVADVDRALLGQPGGALEQPQGGVAVGTDEVLGDLGHLLARLQVALGGAPVDVPHVERDQPAGRVQHVGGRARRGRRRSGRRCSAPPARPARRRTGASPGPATGRPGRGGGRPRAPAGPGRRPPARCRGGRRRDRPGR